MIIRAGEVVTVRDLEGAQVVDLFAFTAHDTAEYLSASHTRAALRRLFPRVGEAFVTDRRRPILTVAQDTSPGMHDLLIAACDPVRYEQLGFFGFHRSCADNLHEVAASFDFRPVVVPQPVNLFMNTPPLPDGSIVYGAAQSKPGDMVRLRAELDLVLILSSCPMDLLGINGAGPTPIQLERELVA